LVSSDDPDPFRVVAFDTPFRDVPVFFRAKSASVALREINEWESAETGVLSLSRYDDRNGLLEAIGRGDCSYPVDPRTEM
jgi:hypothetical protein